MTVVIETRQDLARWTRWLTENPRVGYTCRGLPGGLLEMTLDTAPTTLQGHGMRDYMLAVYRLGIEIWHLNVYDTETGKMVVRVYKALDSGPSDG